LAACVIATTYIPEPCPDNCTGHGSCVNKTLPLDPGAPVGATPNTTLYCQCDKGWEGANCGNGGVILITAAALATGAIVGIVIGVILCVGIAGGSAYAGANAFAHADATAIVNNPLYKKSGNDGENPLYEQNC
jgi:hypothetical protein